MIKIRKLTSDVCEIAESVLYGAFLNVYCQWRLEGGGYKAQPYQILALKRRKARIFDLQPYKAENFFRPALRLTDKYISISPVLSFFPVDLSLSISLCKLNNRLKSSSLFRAIYYDTKASRRKRNIA